MQINFFCKKMHPLTTRQVTLENDGDTYETPKCPRCKGYMKDERLVNLDKPNVSGVQNF